MDDMVICWQNAGKIRQNQSIIQIIMKISALILINVAQYLITVAKKKIKSC